MIGVMGQLEAALNWHRMMRKLLDGRAPATAFGEQEAAFFSPAGQARELAYGQATESDGPR